MYSLINVLWTCASEERSYCEATAKLRKLNGPKPRSEGRAEPKAFEAQGAHLFSSEGPFHTSLANSQTTWSAF